MWWSMYYEGEWFKPFLEPVMVRYVRFHPKEYKYSSPCLRVEVYTSAAAVESAKAAAGQAVAVNSARCCSLM